MFWLIEKLSFKNKIIVFVLVEIEYPSSVMLWFLRYLVYEYTEYIQIFYKTKTIQTKKKKKKKKMKKIFS